MPTLIAFELHQFEEARTRFLRVESPSSGLGPAYNGTSCAGCHNQPATGGVGNVFVLRAGTVRDGRYEVPVGGDIVHLFSTGDHSCQPHIPSEATIVARRIPTPLFGAGLIEAISDSLIRTWEDPDDKNNDGIHGRAALVMDPATHTMRVGRFGWKAQQATLLAFAGEALRNEMGITNDLFPNEIGAGLTKAQLNACDTVADPEDKTDAAATSGGEAASVEQPGIRGIDRLALFMRFLAPVAPLPQNPSIHRGLEMFSRIDCSACHVPELLTGTNDNPALDHKPVRAYSDFLLHDIGTGDGVEQGAAKGNEFRTSPLWGLRYRKLLMHDGSALSPLDAIRQHHGESEHSRQMFELLSESDRKAVLDFLSSL